MSVRNPPSTPPVFIHVDLDGLWTLAGVYGFEERSSFTDDPVFHLALPRMLDLFARRGISAGIFIVGRDLEIESKRVAVAAAIAAGHEPANHSYHHWVGLERRDVGEIRDEISRAQEAITSACGVAPVGFRAPGYDAGDRVLGVCAELGLKYDGSLLPTPWSGALRFAANRLRTRVARELNSAPNLAQFDGQYGSRAGLARNRVPHEWKRASGSTRLMRLPLAVSTGIGLPLHASLGMLLGESRMVTGWTRLLRRGIPETFLFHGLDFLDPSEFADRLPQCLRNSRAFQIPLQHKLNVIEKTLDVIQKMGQPTLARDYVVKHFEALNS